MPDAAPTVQQDNFARSSDGGRTWELATPAPFPGPLYGLSYVRSRVLENGLVSVAAAPDGDDGSRERIVATGPGGV